jgi:hypothetical protein
MSQFYIGTIAGALPPSVATSYVTNSGTAVPAANVLNVLGTNGINTSGLGSTVTISLQNSFIANVTTVGAVTANLFSIPLSAIGNVYAVEVRIAGVDVTNLVGIGFKLFGTILSEGSVASLILPDDKFKDESPADINADANFIVSGNNMIVQVLGVAGATINWGGFLAYVTAM